MFEVVNELLEAHRILVRQVAIADVAAGDGVRGRVYVHREGGKVVVFGVDEGVDAVVLEKDGVVGLVVDGGRAAGGQTGSNRPPHRRNGFIHHHRLDDIWWLRNAWRRGAGNHGRE